MRDSIIIKYREIIAKRYDYKQIKKKPNVPVDITEEVTGEIRNFFLDHLYPEPQQREKLDLAFAELENFVLNPSKVWGLLGNLTSAIFRFGLQLPAALRTGQISLRAFNSAKKFEDVLIQTALDKGYSNSLTDEQFYDCMRSIPHEQIDYFIDEVGLLFSSFSDTNLLAKTIEIMEDVLDKMRANKKLYSKSEIRAIELGVAIIQNGYNLFIKYDKKMKKEMADFITDNEKSFIKELHGKKK